MLTGFSFMKVYLIDSKHKESILTLTELECLELAAHQKPLLSKEIEVALSHCHDIIIDAAIVSNGTIWLEGINTQGNQVVIPC